MHHTISMRLILALLLLSLSADAGTVSRLYDFEPNTKAQADQVDAELDNIISTINGNIDTSNLSIGAFGTSNIQNYSITTIKLVTASVTAEKMAAASVTNSNLGTANLVLSSASGSYITDASIPEIGFVTATVTTSGRPISVKLVPNQDAASSYFRVTSSASTNYFGAVYVYLDGTRKSNIAFSQEGSTRALDGYFSPCSSVVDEVFGSLAAGTHTVTASVIVSTNNTKAYVTNCKLQVWEQ